MLSYTGKRLLQTVFVLFGISLITFILLQVVPGDPVALMLEKRADPETIAKVRSELGLDLPYYVQYLNFIKGAVHLDFGTSYFTKEVVTDALFRCFKVTVKLACMSFVFASAIGIPCGIFPGFPGSDFCNGNYDFHGKRGPESVYSTRTSDMGTYSPNDQRFCDTAEGKRIY